jgi:hypothetical protein
MEAARRSLAVAAACSLAILPAGPAHADTIHACVSNALGLVRIVSGTTSCTRFETPLAWNSEGPAGPEGPPGPPGPSGVTAGISAALFAEVVLDPDPSSTENCAVDFVRGAETASGTPTGNTGECVLDFTLPAGQPQSWGTAYECFTSVPGGYGAPFGTTCHPQASLDLGTGYPRVYVQCLAAGGQALTSFTRIHLLCVQ